MNLASKLFKGDRVIWVIFMALCVVSVIEVYSATSTLAYKSATHWDPIVRHVSFILGGFVLVLLLHHIPCKFYALLTVFLPVSAVLLAITPYFGVVVNGEPRWLEILGIRFQPSEIAKLAVIGYTAFILSKQNMFTEKQMFKYILIGAGIICALIFTNNGSTALLLFSVVLMMMFLGQISFIRLLKFVGILVAAASLMVALLYVMPDGVMDYLPDRAHTWKGRIERFNDPTPSVTFEPGRAVNIDDDDYQVVHAKIAIARGGVLGQFPGYGQQRDFLPQAYSDFIYAIIIEEMGLLGGIIVLLLYIALLVRVGLIARKCDKLFPKYLAMGCGLLFVTQALTNMAVAVDLIPVTGQPLPLISRGGTSTVISCAYIGIILSVSRFGAKMGNEDEESDLSVDSEKLLGNEQEMDKHPLENITTGIEGDSVVENRITDAEENPLESINHSKEEIITESKI